MQRTKKLAVGIGVGTLVVAGTGAVAVASQSAPNPVIRSCVKNTTGAARIIRAGQSCAAGERLVTWNKAGPAGPAGVANVQQEHATRVNIPSGTSTPVSPSCNNNEKVIGGGFISDKFDAVVVATESRLQDPTTWGFTFFNADAGTRQVTAYAICVS